jgi:hypothetical protein
MTITTKSPMDKLMDRVAQMTDVELMDVLEAAKAAKSDRYLIMGLSAEAFHRGLLG